MSEISRSSCRFLHPLRLKPRLVEIQELNGGGGAPHQRQLFMTLNMESLSGGIRGPVGLIKERRSTSIDSPATILAEVRSGERGINSRPSRRPQLSSRQRSPTIDEAHAPV